MLSIPEKKTTSVDLYHPLRSYIASSYSEREVQKLEHDLQNLNNDRHDIEHLSKQPSLAARRDLLQSYYRALCVVETVFPISSFNDEVNVTFTWHEAFEQKQSIFKQRPIQEASKQNIHLEKAAVLFNLGAVYSQIGASKDLSMVGGRTDAAHAFMGAAGTFSYLRENVAAKASRGGPTTVDVSVECAAMLENVMLAQAQECVFENAITKRNLPESCMKMSRQVGLYYEEASAALKGKPLKGHFDKAWKSYVRLKAALFNAEACYRYGLELHKEGEIAEKRANIDMETVKIDEEIAWLKKGISTLSEAKKSRKGASARLLGSIENLEANINKELEKAVKKNDMIYHKKIPSPSLSVLRSLSMVKPTPMNEILDPSKEETLASLVPYSRSQSDVYSQAASNSVAGSNLEGTIKEILDIGGGRWDRKSVVCALDVADNDPNRAVHYLYSGIPERAEVPPAAQVPPGARSTNPPLRAAQPAPRQLASAIPQAVSLTRNEYEAVKRLAALGFDQAHAREVYLFWNKDEELAANELLGEFD